MIVFGRGMGDSVARHAYATAAAVAFVLGACGTTGPGREVAVTVPANGPVSAADRAWLMTTHQDALADVRYGRLAEHKGVTAAVRRAGAALAAERAAFDAKVEHVAAALGVDLPRTERGRQVALARRLDAEAGSRFDRHFVTAMAEEHERALADAERLVRDGSSPAVAALARTSLPALRDHLARLRSADPFG